MVNKSIELKVRVFLVWIAGAALEWEQRVPGTRKIFEIYLI